MTSYGEFGDNGCRSVNDSNDISVIKGLSALAFQS